MNDAGKPTGNKRFLSSDLWCLGFSIVMLLFPLPASAVLGGDASSVHADYVRMQGSLRIKLSQTYTVHEIQTPTGTVIREYLSPQGTVFAVTWQGPWIPDMQQLLGNYFADYERAAQQEQSHARVGRRPFHLERPSLVVQLAGHPRSFAGKAYIPAMLPQGFRAEEMR